MSPIDGCVFRVIFDIAIRDGAKKKEFENEIREYKMFSLIKENRVVPEEGIYITSLYCKTKKEASREASKFAKENKIDNYKISL